MKAQRLLYEKLVLDDGSIVEMKLWMVPEAVPPSIHRLKYSLFYGKDGKRLVGYDNERGKGDHVHYGDVEKSYTFISVERLISDFLHDVAVAGGPNVQSDNPHGALR